MRLKPFLTAYSTVFSLFFLLPASTIAQMTLLQFMSSGFKHIDDKIGRGETIRVACLGHGGCVVPSCCNIMKTATVQVYGRLYYKELKDCPGSYSYFEYLDTRKEPKQNLCLVGHDVEFRNMPYAFFSAFSFNLAAQMAFKMSNPPNKTLQILPGVGYALCKRFRGKLDEQYAKFASLDLILSFDNNFQPAYLSSININLVNLAFHTGIYAGAGIGALRSGTQYYASYTGHIGLKFYLTRYERITPVG